MLKKIGEPVVILAGSAALIVYSCTKLYNPREGWVVSAGLFPMILGCILFLFGIIMLTQAIWECIKAPRSAKAAAVPSEDGTAVESEDGTAADSNGKSNWLGVVLVILATAAFAVLSEHIGFLIASIIYSFAIMLIFRDRKWIWMVGVSVVSCSLLYFSFTRLLHVLLP